MWCLDNHGCQIGDAIWRTKQPHSRLVSMKESEGLTLTHGAALGLSPYLRLSRATADAVLEDAMRRIRRASSALCSPQQQAAA